MQRKYSAIVAGAVVVFAFVGAADAQTPLESKFEARLTAAVKKIQTACDEDLKKYCGTVTPGEGRLLLCLEAHEDKIGSKCDYSLFEASRNLDRALDNVAETADACWNDIEKYCANTPEGGGRVTECLLTKKEALAPPCRSGLGKLFQN
jgi:Golgi apparatus protein 1